MSERSFASFMRNFTMGWRKAFVQFSFSVAEKTKLLPSCRIFLPSTLLLFQQWWHASSIGRKSSITQLNSMVNKLC